VLRIKPATGSSPSHRMSTRSASRTHRYP